MWGCFVQHNEYTECLWITNLEKAKIKAIGYFMYFARIKNTNCAWFVSMPEWGSRGSRGRQGIRRCWEAARLAGGHRFFSPCSSVYFHVFRGVFYFKEYHCVENRASVPSGCTKNTETMIGASSHTSQTCQSQTQWQDLLGCTSSSVIGR